MGNKKTNTRKTQPNPVKKKDKTIITEGADVPRRRPKPKPPPSEDKK